MAYKSIAARNFFNSSFKDFSLYDNVRSIPSLSDGLKPSQRKALYGTFLRGENAGLLSVERLAAAVAASTDYHHGAASLQSTIVGMAVNYPGSNNMNLFVPEGQFGSRLSPDPAAARYIETKLSPNFRKLFKKDDEQILVHAETDGEKIEPVTYAPILPMPLVNGAQGTGTGHACLIMAYKPDDLRAACLKILQGKKLQKNSLTPWYRGFSGNVVRNPDTKQVTITGRLEIVNTTTIKVTELPIGMYLDDFKDVLNKLEEDGFIKDYENRSDEDHWDFTITCPRTTTSMTTEQLLQKFKLISRDTENLTLWDPITGRLRRFETSEDVVERFMEWRIGIYEIRRSSLIKSTEEAISWASEKIRFINFYLKNTEKFKNTGKADLIKLLLDNQFEEYDRLLGMNLWHLTRDRIAELEKELDDLKKRLEKLNGETASAMFARELKELDL